MRRIELLSPAKNIDCGIAAINHGADAVYIGASKFGARAAAGNTIQDIEQLTSYAHKFNARVYTALNTILYDNELEEAQRLIWQLYEAGADAIIVQDMGILQMDLPPIALHASTQTDNRTVEKVQFLEQTGFSQVVLARELSLIQIKEIASQTTVPLEFFVHGALCVSYSGQCYISQAMCGRSANRGECAQYCRLPYDLLDDKGNVLMKNKHLLSLKDMNLSSQLKDLMDAGISSFKIEGRLKEADYVKNITAYYRQKLDVLLDGSELYQKSSSGKTTYSFTPNTQKSFHRGSTSYFLNGRNAEISSFDTPKSIGEAIGEVVTVAKDYIELLTSVELHNGDGLCYLNNKASFEGFRVNRVEQSRVYPFEMPKITVGTPIYRNYDISFDKKLATKSSERKIVVSIRFYEIQNGFCLEVADEDNTVVRENCVIEKEKAKNEQQAFDNLSAQLSKWGNTDYELADISIEWTMPYFIPSSRISEWRRVVIEKLDHARSEGYQPERKKIEPTSHSYPQTELSYLGNVSNHLAEAFYRQHGVTNIASAFELKVEKNVPLMYTKHCLKYSLGICPYKSGEGKPTEKKNAGQLILSYGDKQFTLQFDCARCEMHVVV